MNDLIIKEFQGTEIHTFIWNQKPCWIANIIVGLLDYADSTVTLSQCIAAEEFETGIEYDVLVGKELKEFKTMVKKLTKENLVSPNTPNLTILYEDGLYGFLEYSRKPQGIQFRKWLRREVVPEIRQTGAYITDKANPNVLREKADKIESLYNVTLAVKQVSELYKAAGMNDVHLLMATKMIYRKAGVDLPVVELKAKRELFCAEDIAKMLKINSTSGLPHKQAVGAILSKIEITENEKELVHFEKNGYDDTHYCYSTEVVERVQQWLECNKYPCIVEHNGKQYKVFYK